MPRGELSEKLILIAAWQKELSKLFDQQPALPAKGDREGKIGVPIMAMGGGCGGDAQASASTVSPHE